MSKTTTTTEPTKEEGPRSFAKFIHDLADGECESETSYELHELMKRCQEEAAARGVKVKGSLTFKINFNVEQSAKQSIVQIGYEVTAKAPKRRTSPATFWLTKNGNLTAHNPAQQKLALREVTGPDQREARDVGEAPAANQREV